ncbi:MAG: methylornithine synthase PylB [Desulfobacteraceae bacterium]|nr:MAG: methylornithine synthase PylB [Desulfobacteraceae bacterium]
MTAQLLIKVQQGQPLCREDIKGLLSLSDPSDLFAAARQARQAVFGESVFLYGFLYFSTHCRNNCGFCHYRRGNTGLARYRKTLPEIITSAKQMVRSGVHLIDLTMGEDPEFFQTGFRPLIKLVRAVKRETGLPIMISPGVVPDRVVQALCEEGAQWLACYQETHNRGLYASLRSGQDYDRRMASKTTAAQEGMLVEEGLLTGVGETLDDLTDSIMAMRDHGYDQVRVMTFVPQAGTPMAKQAIRKVPEAASRMLEQKVIAVMRLAMPDRLIPASLDVDGLGGLKDRLDAGANVVTSIVPPASGLAGVANHTLDIEESRRSVAHVTQVLADCGLSAASIAQYREWIKKRQSEKAAHTAAGAA